MFEFGARCMKSVHDRNPQCMSFDHAVSILAESTVLRQMLSVQIRLRDDAFMCTQLLHDLRCGLCNKEPESASLEAESRSSSG